MEALAAVSLCKGLFLTFDRHPSLCHLAARARRMLNGLYTGEAIAGRRKISKLMRAARALARNR